jgi:sRNA-binding protein
LALAAGFAAFPGALKRHGDQPPDRLGARQILVLLSPPIVNVRQLIVAGAVRVDLDGKGVGEVTARDAEYAAAKLAEILASREARRVAAVAAKGQGAVQVARPTAATVAAAAPPAAKVLTLKERPVLRLPAFRQRCG